MLILRDAMSKKRNKNIGLFETDPRNGYNPHEELGRLPLRRGKRLINVFVEGYEDVAFWRGIFDAYESSKLTFEISVPPRGDLAKGKKIVVHMAEHSDPRNNLFCVDSDFDYLFADQTEMARYINNTPNIFHTYAYATENYICYAGALHNICVKATKNDTRIFDFERFFRDYSRAIYPLFLWYAYSAQINAQKIFTLVDFRSSVKINYLEVENNGADTIAWLQRQVERRVGNLIKNHPEVEKGLDDFAAELRHRGVSADNTYLFIQGHTLMDNVVMPVLEAVCDRLRRLSLNRIENSSRRGVSLVNEQSNYNNAVSDVRTALLFNENYKDCYLYLRVKRDIEAYLEEIRD